MKKIISTLLLIGLAACSNNDLGTNNNQSNDQKAYSQTGQCLIDFVDPQDGESFGFTEKYLQNIVYNKSKKWNSLNFRPVDSPYSESNHLYVIDSECPSNWSIEDSIFIENMEPSAIYSIPNYSSVDIANENDLYGFPNDPLYKHQWNFEMIDISKAWENSRQGEGAIVAVIDTGVGYKDHGDYKALEDLNKTKFTKGVSFTRDGLPDGLDDHAHGSHVAGTIAQSTNNGIGVAGIAPKATIMPLKVLSAHGGGTTQDIASAIRYAADNGANVINMSLGGPYPSKVMEDAVDYAHEKGVIVICAAGNEKSSRVGYPAGYEHCMSVSSIDRNGNLAWYSNYGNDIDISAPGGDTRNDPYDGIVQNTLDPTNPRKRGYFGFQGTSMAAPHVAGVAALIVGEGITDNEEVWQILEDSAHNPNGREWDEIYGSGIVNAYDAVMEANDGDNDDGTIEMPIWKIIMIGGVLFILIIFVGWKGYKSIKSIDSDYDKYTDDID